MLACLSGLTLASTLTTISDSIVVYTSTTGTHVAISRCDDASLENADPTRALVDYNLRAVNTVQDLATGPTVFRECVRTRPVLALGDNGFTQAVIDNAAANLEAGVPFNATSDGNICVHHVRRCFMFYDADPTGDLSSPVVNGTAVYNITITYNGAEYNYPVPMSQCGEATYGYHHWLENVGEQLRNCFLHQTPMASPSFAVALQSSEEPHTPPIATLGRYGWVTALVCNKQQHVCNSIPENQGLSAGCLTELPKCRAALKHLDHMMIREDPNEQQVRAPGLGSLWVWGHCGFGVNVGVTSHNASSRPL